MLSQNNKTEDSFHFTDELEFISPNPNPTPKFEYAETGEEEW